MRIYYIKPEVRTYFGGEENFNLEFSSPQFAYKNSGFWDQICKGDLKPQRCTQLKGNLSFYKNYSIEESKQKILLPKCRRIFKCLAP